MTYYVILLECRASINIFWSSCKVFTKCWRSRAELQSEFFELFNIIDGTTKRRLQERRLILSPLSINLGYRAAGMLPLMELYVLGEGIMQFSMRGSQLCGWHMIPFTGTKQYRNIPWIDSLKTLLDTAWWQKLTEHTLNTSRQSCNHSLHN